MTNLLARLKQVLVSSLLPLLTLSCVEFTQLGVTGADVNLRVAFVSCAANAPTDEALTVIDDATGQVVSTGAVHSAGVTQVRTATATVPSGLYHVAVGRLPCVASEAVVLLPGINRSVVLVGGDALRLRERAVAIAGSLPSSGLFVSAECKSPTGDVQKYNADVQGAAYYFDSIEVHGSCEVSVGVNQSSTNKKVILGHVVIDSSVPTKLVVHNIDWTDIFHL